MIGAPGGELTAGTSHHLSVRGRLLASGAIYAVLAALCVVVAYWAVFSKFQTYDDEGFFDYSLNLFRTGHPLYTSVFSDYGPFYYELFGGMFALLHHAVTTDAGRLVQLVIWVGLSLALGVAAHKLTGHLTIGVMTLATSFSVLVVLINEPMHAGALVVALLTAMALVIACALTRRPAASLTTLGALTAALLLTKINVGGFAIISIAFAVVFASPALIRSRTARSLAIAALILVGPVLMLDKLNTGPARSYAVLAVLSTASLAIVAVPVGDPAREDAAGPTTADETSRWLRWLLGGFMACLVLVLAIALVLGSSLPDLLDQLIAVPSRQGSFFSLPIVLGSGTLLWSLAATGLAWVDRRRRPSLPDAAPSLYGGLLRLLAGVAILRSLGNAFPFPVGPNATFALAMPLAWVAALPSRHDHEPRARLARLLIPSLAVLQCLQAYPVAGSQLGFGSLLLVLCGAVCVADGWSELMAWSNARAAVTAAALYALLVVVALGSVVDYIVNPIGTYHNQYRQGTPLRIAGATRLRLSPPLTMALTDVVAELRAAQCHTLLTFPGMYSFNVWTGLPAPSPFTGEQPFWRMLTPPQQDRVLAAAKASRGLCEVRNDVELAFYGGAPRRPTPLVTYAEQAFRPVAQYGPYVVAVRRT